MSLIKGNLVKLENLNLDKMNNICGLCKGSNTVKLFTTCNIHGRYILNKNDVFDIFRCDDCGLVFVSDVVVNQAYYSKYYAQNYYYPSGSFSTTAVGLLSKISLKIKEKQILKYTKLDKSRKVRILDIGCGCGDFLVNLSHNRFEKFGIEINPDGFNACKNKSIKVYNQEIQDVDFEDNSFDVVTLWHVLEHFKDPVLVLKQVKRILSKNGVLIIATPNTDSLGFKFGNKFWFHLDSPRHLMLYNRKSITALLKQVGFSYSEESNAYYDYPLDLFWSIRFSVSKLIIYPLYLLFKLLDKENLLLICERIQVNQ